MDKAGAAANINTIVVRRKYSWQRLRKGEGEQETVRCTRVPPARRLFHLGAEKRPDQWVVGFALETDDRRFRAITKLEKKSCDLIVLNGPAAMDSAENSVEILDRTGQVVESFDGPKDQVARGILGLIHQRLIVTTRR